MITGDLMNPAPLINQDAPAIEDSSSDESLVVRNKKKIIIIATVSIVTVLIIVGVVLGFVLTKKDNTIPFLFINDLHVDPKYNELAIASKDKMCRNASAPTGVKRPFGQYNCDAPESVLSSMAHYLPKAVKNPEFILFGGDSVGHNLGLDNDGLRKYIQSIFDKIEEQYPKVPIFVALGNNDFAVNYGSFNTDAADFESMSKVFGKHMTSAELETFKKGGYYFRDFPSQNLRLFMLNTVMYSRVRKYNETLTDPHGQLAWLDEKCKEAENKGLKIGLSMHIAPGVTYYDYKQGWNTYYIHAFYNVIKKYNIEFALSGHTHLDLLLPFHTEEKENAPLFYTLSAPAMTPAHKNNPAFRVYYLKDGALKDYDQYYADIMLNPQNEMNWKLEYKFTEAFGEEDVSMKAINNAVNWIRTTGEGQWRYREYIYSRADDHNSFYYCILKSVTTEEAKNCTSGLNSKLLVPYGTWDD